MQIGFLVKRKFIHPSLGDEEGVYFTFVAFVADSRVKSTEHYGYKRARFYVRGVIAALPRVKNFRFEGIRFSAARFNGRFLIGWSKIHRLEKCFVEIIFFLSILSVIFFGYFYIIYNREQIFLISTLFL